MNLSLAVCCSEGSPSKVFLLEKGSSVLIWSDGLKFVAIVYIFSLVVLLFQFSDLEFQFGDEIQYGIVGKSEMGDKTGVDTAEGVDNK